MPTWSPSSPFLGAKEFDPGKHIQLVLVAASFALAGAVDTLTGIGLLPLPGLSLLADQGAGDGCSHGRHRPGATGGSGTQGLLAGHGCHGQHAARLSPVPGLLLGVLANATHLQPAWSLGGTSASGQDATV